MNWPRVNFGLPLLAKELAEQAARMRTYVVRVVYACSFFVAAYVMFQATFAQAGNAFGLLGQGGRMFATLAIVQLYSIYLFMPAITSGAITHEKERNCLGLLLLTHLGPLKILLEKLLSRLIPMYTFLLLAMPVMAFTYMLGGVSTGQFWATLVLLAVTCIMVGSFSLACSAYCQSTVTAFVTTYVLGVFFFTCLLPVNGFMSTTGIQSVEVLIAASVAEFCFAVVFLAVAKVFLVEHAFMEPRDTLLEFFKVLDGIFWDMNRVTGGIVLVNENTSLPKDRALAWRETTKKSLGTVRYLFRILTMIEGPLVLILAFVAEERAYSTQGVAANLVFTLWIIAIAMISIKATSLVSSERTRQTLEVLLTIPMSGRDILLEKFHGVRRLMIVMSIPFLTVLGLQVWWERGGWTRQNFNLWLFSATSFSSLVIFLPLIAWVSLWIGLVARSQARAILVSLGVIFGWVYLPYVYHLRSVSFGTPIFPDILSPAYLIVTNESRKMTLGLAVGFCVFYGIVLYCVRRFCLANADFYLGRCEPEPDPATQRNVALVIPTAEHAAGS